MPVYAYYCVYIYIYILVEIKICYQPPDSSIRRYIQCPYLDKDHVYYLEVGGICCNDP
jgi:hypothetical protein